MTIRQLANSLKIIWHTEESNRALALMRHTMWQGRKLLFPRPARLKLSQSIITDDEPGGVISLVNMLGLYDYNNMHLVQYLLAEGSDLIRAVFLDVGANIGAYTLIASEVATATVISLEPIPAAFAKLRHNVRINGRMHVMTLQVAAGRAAGELRMTCDCASTINHVVAPGQVGDKIIAVPADTLDAICARLAVSPTVIKIDVEGHEPAVLEGARECLVSCHACLVENGDRASVVALMHASGMAGPYYYRHRLRQLQRSPQALAEDQIYIGPNFNDIYPMIAIDRAC